MKRNSMKSGSTVTPSTINPIPPYQPLNTISANKLIQQQQQDANSIFSILQQDQKKTKATRIQSTSAQPSIQQQQPLSKVAFPQTSSSSSQVNPSSSFYAQSSVPTLPQSYSSNSLLGSTSKQPEHLSLLQLNQRLLLSTQKAGSLNPSSSSANSQQAMPFSVSSTSKSPVNTAPRSNTQSTPTQQKTISHLNSQSNLGLSPKLQPSNSQKSASTTTFHSHRPSLAGQQSANPQFNNENLNLNRRHDSKPDLQKKSYYSQGESLITPNNVLRENNNLKNLMHYNPAALHPSIPSSSSIKDFSMNLNESLSKQLNSKNPRNNSTIVNPSYNTESSLAIATTAVTTTGSIQGNLLKNSNLLSSSPNAQYTNQLSSEKNTSFISGNRTPKSPSNSSISNSLSDKHNLHFILHQNTAHSQNTDNNDLHTNSMEQQSSLFQSNILNTSGLSTITQSNLTDRGAALDPPSSSIMTSPQQTDGGLDFLGQKCSNHPDKKAKYIIQNPQSSNNLYCSKCAVELSKFGFQTIHLSDYAKQQSQQSNQTEFSSNSSNEISKITSPSRQNLTNPAETETQIKSKEINGFLQVIEEQGVKWQELNHALLIKKKDVSNFFERQQSRVENQYCGYFELLNQMRDATLQKLQQNKEKSVLIYQQWEKETKESLTDFINIKADIEMNADKIVNLIQMDDFRRIMGSYQEKLSKMRQFFSSMGNECVDLIKFDNQSPPPVALAPQLQSSFSLLNFSTTLVKKRVSEFISNKKHSNDHNTSNSSLSPNLKHLNASRSITESARGSLAGSEIHSHNFTKLQSPSMNSQQYLQMSENQYENYNVTCNSPVKNDGNSKQDQQKKDVYMSFGNNKELNKAILQGKNPPQASSSQVISHQYPSAGESLQATPLHNNGVYIHQIKPLTDIIENTNGNEEDDKSQPNTPELKQLDDIPQRIGTPSQAGNGQQQLDQQKPFRTLFGEEDNGLKNQMKSEAEEQRNTSSSASCSVPSALEQQYAQSAYSQLQNQQLKSPGNSQSSFVNGLKQGSSGSSKSPRYSIYDPAEGENDNSQNIYQYHHNNLQVLPLKNNNNNNNQLEDYLQILEKQNTQQQVQPQQFQGTVQANPLNNSNYSDISYRNDLPSNANSCYVSANCSPNTSKLTCFNNQQKEAPTNQQQQQQQIFDQMSLMPNEEDVVIVTHDKQEEMDNPLFSSPSYKQ